MLLNQAHDLVRRDIASAIQPMGPSSGIRTYPFYTMCKVWGNILPSPPKQEEQTMFSDLLIRGMSTGWHKAGLGLPQGVDSGIVLESYKASYSSLRP